jgi:hypothetical protein
VAEWPALDDEARQITEKILGTGSAALSNDVLKTIAVEVPIEL